jgi:hypothetical protein
MLGLGSPDSLAVIELEDSALEGLTSAQQAFVRLVHSGLSNTEAYRRVYGQGERSDNALGVAAHTVAHDPKVQLKLKYLREKAEAQSSLLPRILLPRINREYVIDGIKKLADSELVKPNTRLAAYIALGKTREVNLFGSDPIEQPQQRSVDDIDKQLLAMLRGMVSTIDGQATDITPTKEKAPAVKPGPAGVGRKRKPRA